ncbi:HpcH/HpaI aldolase family protein [Marinibacterium sp. SX1]|uniref:HpcH/HpaI aldolase family protein n=1 Tax=Marinibacterium sp. SX1 TaxID=3388424 RepID=UPI003D17EF86
MSYRAAFARRLRAREGMAGTFIKSADPAVVEVLGLAGLDFAILDAEHVGIDRAGIAAMMVASRAAGLPVLVRIPQLDGHWIATALDAGAAGIMAPQVPDAATATRLAARMRYGPGGRGFSPSTPGAGYGSRGIAAHLAAGAGESVLVCQIEDPGAVAHAEEIAEVEGVDGLLVGPVDLAVSAGFTSAAEPEVARMTRAVLGAAGRAGKAGGLFLGQPGQAPGWQADGANLFVLGTDQGYVLNGARQALAEMRGG